MPRRAGLGRVGIEAEHQVQDGRPRVVVARAERGVGNVEIAAGDLGDDPAARRRSLALAGSTSIMRSPCTRPRRTIAAVVSALSATFCAVPAVSRVEPRSTSAPTVDLDGEVGDRGQR